MQVKDPRSQKILDCLETADLSAPAGKLALCHVVTRVRGSNYTEIRNAYCRNEGMSGPDASRRAAMDVVATLEGTEEEPAVSDLTSYKRLVLAVRERERRDSGRVGIAQCIAWVSGNLPFDVEDLRVEDIPGVRALGMWKWAKTTETEFRRTFEGRLIPAKGLAEDEKKGWVDDGRPIKDIMSRMGLALLGSAQDVSMRHLQAEESDGHDRQPEDRVHDLPERDAEGHGGNGSGRAGGQGGDIDGGAGIADPGPGRAETGAGVGADGVGPDGNGDVSSTGPQVANAPCVGGLADGGTIPDRLDAAFQRARGGACPSEGEAAEASPGRA